MAVWVVRVADSLIADAAEVVATAVDERILPAAVHSLDRLFLRTTLSLLLLLWPVVFRLTC